MKRLFFWTTVFSGLAAAYLMFRRGESLSTIASEVTSNPIGSLGIEIKEAL